MPTQAYRLPHFLALLPKKPGGDISPSFKDADTGFNSWIYKKVGWLFVTEVYNAEIPLLAALAYPLASYQELRAIIDYMTSSLMLEVMTDHSPSTKVKSISELWLRTLAQHLKDSERLRHPFFRAMHRELVPNMRAAVDPFHWPQFIDSNVKYANNGVQEALDREKHSNKNMDHDIQSYMVMRRESVGTRPCFVLLRSTRRLYVPDDILLNPVIKDLENVALDMVYIANDVYSFKKEFCDDCAPNNLLTVMQQDPATEHLDLQERLDHSEKLFKAALERFNACREKLPLFDLEQQLSAYADGLIDWVIGNIEWSGLNHRYNAFSSFADKKNNIMRVDVNRRKLHRFFLLLFVAFIIPIVYYVYYYFLV